MLARLDCSWECMSDGLLQLITNISFSPEHPRHSLQAGKTCLLLHVARYRIQDYTDSGCFSVQRMKNEFSPVKSHY